MRKNMKTALSLLSVMLIASCFSFKASAHKNMDEGWKERIKAEKVAFLTSEIGLTPEEAQVFWPVYNQVEAEKDAAMREVIKSYKELRNATEEGRSAKELSDLLDKHIEAQKNLRAMENGIAERYKAVLPVEKVVRLYVGEEKFRRHHIRKMKSGNQEGRPEPKN